MHEITPASHAALARQFRRALATYEDSHELINLGAYQRGSDARVDAAIALWPQIQQFLQQDMHERVDLASSLGALDALFPPGAAP
jgi:flagellum-specific ATP synthase